MITSLRLTDWRSFSGPHTIPLGAFTIIVGSNASGKSNLRDAFRFLHAMGRGYNLAEILGGKYGDGGECLWHGIRGGVREIVHGTGEGRFGIESAVRAVVPASKERPAELWSWTHRLTAGVKSGVASVCAVSKQSSGMTVVS